ncbi:hypothetical protein Taro_048787 [Colocasia esculenta]|uniref:Uncharacterized protein n=1 Tax=Colocasia esculenta TaxID=4460 RepID=A0A843X921_COLES|nr:hypothetical protein [Colocasia esculenta]
MKKAGALVASAAAASSVALHPVGTASSSSSTAQVHRSPFPVSGNGQEAPTSSPAASRTGAGEPGASRGAAEGRMFAPRFDGLRFIETLVTAHR